jgi:hypothetical protein
MKVYVLGYRPKNKSELDEDARRTGGVERPVFRPAQQIAVGYIDEPQWRMAERELAEWECCFLRGMDVHVYAHRCDFSVETLPEGDLAVVCLTHPPRLKRDEP